MANQTTIIHGLRFPGRNMTGTACTGNICMRGYTAKQLSMDRVQSAGAEHLSAAAGEAVAHDRKRCDQCSNNSSSC